MNDDLSPTAMELSPEPTPTAQAQPDRTADAAAKRRLAFIVAAYVIFSLVVPAVRIHLPHHRVPLVEAIGLELALAFLPTAVFMFLQISLSSAIVGLRMKPLAAAAVMAAGVALWFPTILFMYAPRGWPVAAILVISLCRTLCLGLLITFACSGLGILLSRIVREANVLMPAALIAMPIDYIGAMTPIGFTQNVMTKHPSVVKAVSVPVPHLGGLAIAPFIGPGDVLFMAFFFAIVQRLELNERGTFRWICGLLTLAMLFVIAAPGLNIAALVPMGLAVLIANRRFFRLQRSEVFAVLYAGALVLTIVVGFYIYGHTHFFRH